MKPVIDPDHIHRVLRLLQASSLPMAVAFTISFSLIAVTVFIHFWAGVPVGDLTRDPVAVTGGAVYIGFLSQTGIFFWAASAAVCLFTAHVLARRPDVAPARNFFFAAGLLSLLLGIDDVFLLHERLLPGLGIPELVVYGTYVALILLWLVRYRGIMMRSEYVLLGMALAFFGISVMADALNPDVPGRVLLEDGAKITGIVSWLVYFFRCGALELRNDAGRPGSW